MTDAFDYLSVLLSIVLGLALAQLLTGVGRLVQQRARVRVYWPAMVWTAALLLILVQSWWTLFEFRDHTPWTLPEFVLILAHPTVLYFMTVLILPDTDLEGPIDLRANFYAQAPWFFAAAAAVVLLSLARPPVFDGALTLDVDVAIQLVFLVAAVAGAVVRSPRYHEANALLFPGLLLAYIGVLFFDLQ